MARARMVSAFRAHVACAVLLGMSVCARADLTPEMPDSGALEPVLSVNAPAGERALLAATLPSDIVAATLPSDIGADGDLPIDWLGGGVGSGLNDLPAAPRSTEHARANVIQLPASPGSMGLFLSAALSIGAWQLVRSARNLHFAALPEWYHSGGPDQIGHAVSFDVTLTTLPLCETLAVLDDLRPVRFGRSLDAHRPRDVQFCSIVTSRGPPVSA